jgi:pyruvate dehydrogenase E1 component alpha subunit
VDLGPRIVNYTPSFLILYEVYQNSARLRFGMTFETIQYLDEYGILTEGAVPTISDQDLVRAYQVMLLTRHVDERMITLQRQGAISFALSSLGEEGCVVGSAAALESGDWIYPQYREVGAAFWRGFPIQQYLHHMFGNAEDLSLGRQMPNHFGSRQLNIVTVSSPIGTKIPHAAGCAYAMKLQRDPHISIVYFGEGASSEGDFHAGVNFAAVRKAPVIFFCRNNNYAISTVASQQFASDGIAPKGIGYGIPAFRVDGNDLIAVYEVTKRAREYCTDGNGPVLIEAMTYRRGAHSTSDDPSQYRIDDEVRSWGEKDPITRLRRYLERRQLWNQTQEDLFLKAINDEVTEAIAKAKATPKPPLETLFKDVYFEVPASLQEQHNEIKQYLEADA